MAEKPATETTYSISDLAQEFNVTPRAIRFYEDRDLIKPDRVGQNRIYSNRDRTRLAWILRGKRVGLSLGEIGELLDMYDLGDNRVTQRRATLQKLRERVQILERQREDIEATIHEVGDFCQIIEDLLAKEDPVPAKAG